MKKIIFQVQPDIICHLAAETHVDNSIHNPKDFIQTNIPSISFNAGHDLNLNNLEFFLKSIPIIKEVSIGHAIICDAMEFGLEKTLEKYLAITKKN